MSGIRPYISKRQRNVGETKPSSITGTKKPCLEETSENKDETVVTTVQGIHIDKNTSSTSLPTKSRKSQICWPKRCVQKLKCHENAVNHVRWNNSLSNSFLATASMDGSVLILNCNRNGCAILKSLNSHVGAVKDVQWKSDDQAILSGGYDKHAKITDIETGKEMFHFKHKDFVTSVLFHPELQDVFLSGTFANGIYAIDSKSGKEIHHYRSFFGQVQDLLFHPNGEIFFSAAEILKRNSMDKAIVAWDFKTTAIMSNQISQEVFGCSCLQNHPVDPVLLAQYGTGYISIFSNVSPYKLNKYKRFEGHQTGGFNIGFSINRDGGYVASGDREGQIHIYNYATSRSLTVLPAYSTACMDVAFHPSLVNVLASCSWDGEVSLWE